MLQDLPALARFDLERWLRGNEPKARHAIGGSGCPTRDLQPFLPRGEAGWRRAWKTPHDAAAGALRRGLAASYHLPESSFLLTNGASEADFVAALGLAGPGGHVVVEEPTYFALLEPARSLGCRVTRVRRRPEEGFALDPGRVIRALRRDTRLVVLARPHNPSGHHTAETALVEIAHAARRRGAFVLVDEVFAEASNPTPRPARRLHENLLSVNSLTKCLGFGPLHVGWLSGPAKVVERLDRAKAHVRPLMPALNLVLAERILRERRALLAQTQRLRRLNVATVRARLEPALGARARAPRHGTTMAVRLPDKDDVGFARRLLSQTGVLVAPGSFIELPGWIRIGLLSPPTHLKAGLKVLADELRPAEGA